MESALSMFIAKVVRTSAVSKAVRVSVQNMEFDKMLNVYFNKEAQLWASDPHQKYNVGDLVIVKKLAEAQSADIRHYVAEPVFHIGNVIDPVTGRRCRGPEYVDEANRSFNKLGLVVESKPTSTLRKKS